MVLWEIALATAYFMGLPRTYRLGLKIQRRLISRKHPRTRQFLRSRTRDVFSVALKAQRSIQAGEIEARRRLGNVFSSRAMWSRALPTAGTVMPPWSRIGSLARHGNLRGRQRFGRGSWGGVIRKDIAQWMMMRK